MKTYTVYEPNTKDMRKKFYTLEDISDYIEQLRTIPGIDLKQVTVRLDLPIRVFVGEAGNVEYTEFSDDANTTASS